MMTGYGGTTEIDSRINGNIFGKKKPDSDEGTVASTTDNINQRHI
jgi:hypothetical protein